MSELVPSAWEALTLQLATIAAWEPAGGMFEVRYRLAAGGMGQSFHPLHRTADVIAEVLRRGQETDVYLGAAPRRRRHGGAAAIDRAWCVWADLDTPEALARLEAFPIAPSLLVQTSDRGVHAWWALRSALAPRYVEQANRRLAYALGGDQRSIDVARILRAPGTLNHKRSPASPVEALAAHGEYADIRALVGTLPDPPEPQPLAEPRTGRPREQATDDELLAIPPREYVEALCGRVADRAGMIVCPFHEDRTPSLKVYDDPERGWTCFGCRRGGSIIDFAAHIYVVEPRGRGYHDLRRRLLADLRGVVAA